jgi:hypothetical protein
MEHATAVNTRDISPDDLRVEIQIDRALTWELVYELREAANMAHGLGRDAQEQRLTAWADRLTQILSPGQEHATEACISQIYVG